MTVSDHKSDTQQARSASFNWIAASSWALWLAVALLLIAVLCVSLQRTLFGIYAELDFVSSFAPEAERILADEPLRLDFHPPGYAFAVALGRLLAGEWLAGALWISGLSVAILMLASVLTYRRLAGRAAAWGALIACACSMHFFASASTASSDMMFAALVGLLLMMVVQAMDAPHRFALWLCTGVVAACAILTRSNGLVAALVLAAPLLIPAERSSRIRVFVTIAIGLLLPLAAWSMYATATSSPLKPTHDYLNLAVSIFGDDALPWGDSVIKFEHEFDGMIDVLTRDPAQTIFRLTKRILSLPRHLGWKLTWPPIVALAVPGVLYMLWRRKTPAFLLVLLICTALTMLSAVVEFKPRYHLVLIPFMGAMAAVTCEFLANRLASRKAVQMTLACALLVVVAVVSARAYAPVLGRLESSMQLEFSEVIPHVLRESEPRAIIYARTDNLAFETGRRSVLHRADSSVAELHQKLCRELGPTEPAYLYFGIMERQFSSKLASELSAVQPVAWLELIAAGEKTEWSLYRVRIYRPEIPQDQRCHENAVPATA